MLRSFLVMLVLTPGLALAQQSYSGTFVYQSPQGSVQLVLAQQGNAVSGTMTAPDGSAFQLRGMLEGQGVTGTIQVGQENGFFALGFVGNQLRVIVAERDPASGQPDMNSSWSLDFLPAGGAPAGPIGGGPGAMQPPGPQPGVQQPAAERDRSLIGYWVHTDTYRSGDFFANTTLQMLIKPDGTYEYGAGNVSLGGNYMGNTGRTGNVTTGQWRTQGGVVYVMETGSPQWVPHARYYVEGASLMLTFANGNRQLWERR